MVDEHGSRAARGLPGRLVAAARRSKRLPRALVVAAALLLAAWPAASRAKGILHTIFPALHARGDGAAAAATGATATPAQWAQRAEAAQRVLLRDFADDGRPGLFRLRAPGRSSGRTPLMYWWQAQALDLLLDRQERSPTAAGRARIAALIDGVRRANGGRVVNSYYDDMGWMALALLRADALGLPTIGLVRRLWWEIRKGWNRAQGGGIAWRAGQPGYKNVPANGPAAILAARLYARDRRPGDLAWSRRIVAYVHRRLVDPGSGRVYDGVNRRGDGRIDRDWTFSYDVGLVVGADLALQAVTGDASLRARALRVARANLGVIAPAGVLDDEGPGDGALFRGIAARYLAALADPEVDAVLQRSAQAAWTARNGAGRFGDSWARPPTGSTELSAQVGGAMLLEQLARRR